MREIASTGSCSAIGSGGKVGRFRRSCTGSFATYWSRKIGATSASDAFPESTCSWLADQRVAPTLEKLPFAKKATMRTEMWEKIAFFLVCAGARDFLVKNKDTAFIFFRPTGQSLFLRFVLQAKWCELSDKGVKLRQPEAGQRSGAVKKFVVFSDFPLASSPCVEAAKSATIS